MISESTNPKILGNNCAPVVHSRYVCGAPNYLVTGLTLDSDTGVLTLYQNPDNCLSIQIPAILDQQKVAEIVQGMGDSLDASKVDKTYRLRTVDGIQGGGTLEKELTLSIQGADEHIVADVDGLRIQQFNNVTTSGTVKSPTYEERDSNRYLNALNKWVTINTESNLSIGENSNTNLEIENDNGIGVVLNEASSTKAGLLSSTNFNYLTDLKEGDIITKLNTVKVTSNGFAVDYEYLNSTGIRHTSTLVFPIVTDTEAGLITPELVEEIHDNTGKAIVAAVYTISANEDAGHINFYNKNNEVVSEINIPTVTSNYIGLATPNMLSNLNQIMETGVVTKLENTITNDGAFLDVSYLAGGNKHTDTLNIPIADETTPGLISTDAYNRIMNFADRDAVILVQGEAKSDCYKIHVDTRYGTIETYNIPLVNENFAGLVTKQMTDKWDYVYNRKDVVDVLGEHKTDTYNVTVKYSDDSLATREIKTATHEYAGLMSVSDKAVFDLLPDSIVIDIPTAGKGAISGLDYTFNFKNIKTGTESTKILNIPNVTSELSGLMSASDKKKLNNIEGYVSKISDFTHAEAGVNTIVETYYPNTDVTMQTVVNIPLATRTSNGVISKELFTKFDNIGEYVIGFDNPDTWDESFTNPKPDYASIYNYYKFDPNTGKTIQDRFYLPIADENFPGVITAEMYKELLTTANQSRVLERFTGEITAKGYNISGIRRSGELMNTISVPIVSTEMPGLVTSEYIKNVQGLIDDKISWTYLSESKVIKSFHIDPLSTVITTGSSSDPQPILLIQSPHLINFGNMSYSLLMNGSEPRPLYNLTEVALLSDVKNVEGKFDDITKDIKNDIADNYVPYVRVTKDEGKEHKTILLDNHSNLNSKDSQGSTINLIESSPWDVVEVGDIKLGLNFSGREARPTYNDNNLVAFLSDVDAAVTTSLEWYEGD